MHGGGCCVLHMGVLMRAFVGVFVLIFVIDQCKNKHGSSSYRRVVAHKCDAMSRIAGARAKPALFQPHGWLLCKCC